MLVNAAIEDYSVAKLQAVVLDELHMIDDEHRGYTLELIATKLLSLEHTVQIVGMSATIPVSILHTLLWAFANQKEHGPHGQMAQCALIRDAVPTYSH